MLAGILASTISFHILFGLILTICLYEMNNLRKGKSKIIPFIYVLIPLTLIHTFNQDTVLSIFIITCLFDSFAYITGVNFGKHKMIPAISPKKSWEGFLGGFTITVLITYYATHYQNFNLSLNWLEVIILPLSATIGDFIASYYKRLAKVKDTGKIIPGHGGMLDRMDAFMISIPVIFITNIYL